MQLTCPTCRSGLQVPDGTTAHVRCPTCRTIFPASAGLLPPPPPPAAPPPPPLKPRPVEPEAGRRKVTARRVDSDDETDRPARRTRADDRDRPRAERRKRADRKPTKRPRRRYDEDDGEERTAEKQRLADAFARAMWGCRLISWGLLLQILALVLILAFVFLAAITKEARPALLVAAGVAGLINWLLRAAGTGLCLSGPPSLGYYRVAIPAAVLVVVHLVLVWVIATRTYAADDIVGARGLDDSAGRWLQVPTQLTNLTYYLVYAAYANEIGRSSLATPYLVTGVVEMCRLMMIMLTMSGLARAAGEERLMHRCVRVAGIVTFGPGGTALVFLAFTATVLESGGQGQGIFLIGFFVLVLGMYAVIAGIMFISMTAANETADACEFPFHSQIVDLA